MRCATPRLPAMRRDLPERSIIINDGADPKVLEAIGIRQADVVAGRYGFGMKPTWLSQRWPVWEYGVKRVVGRVNNPKNAWMFTPMMGVGRRG